MGRFATDNRNASPNVRKPEARDSDMGGGLNLATTGSGPKWRQVCHTCTRDAQTGPKGDGGFNEVIGNHSIRGAPAIRETLLFSKLFLSSAIHISCSH